MALLFSMSDDTNAGGTVALVVLVLILMMGISGAIGYFIGATKGRGKAGFFWDSSDGSSCSRWDAPPRRKLSSEATSQHRRHDPEPPHQVLFRAPE
jgi:hypothetical protein